MRSTRNPKPLKKVPCTKHRGLGLVVANSFIVNANCERRTTKQIKDFYQIKRILSPSCNLYSKFNAYVGHVIPIINFASKTRIRSIFNMHEIEKVQQLAAKCNLNFGLQTQIVKTEFTAPQTLYGKAWITLLIFIDKRCIQCQSRFNPVYLTQLK